VDTTQEGRHRRRYTAAFRRQVVEETLAGGESVSVVARRHDLNANLLFTWRRRYRQGTLAGAAEETALLPIRVRAASAEQEVSKPAAGGAELELLLTQGHRVRVRGAVAPEVLRAALEVLSR